MARVKDELDELAGKRLRLARKIFGFSSRHKLAEHQPWMDLELPYSKESIKRYENNGVPKDQVRFIAQFFKVSDVDFINPEIDDEEFELLIRKSNIQAQDKPSPSLDYDENHSNKTIEKLSDKLALDPNDAKSYYARGYARIEIGQFEKAIHDLDKSIALDGEDAFSYYLRWAANVYQGNPDSNYEDLVKAIEKKSDIDWDTIQPIPDNSTALGARAKAYIENKDFVRASEDFIKARSLSEKFTDNEIEGKLNRHFLAGKTVEELDIAEKLCPNLSDPYHKRGKLYLENLKYKNAAIDFTSAIKKNNWLYGSLFDEKSDCYYLRAKSHAKSGLEKEALEDLDACLKLNPKHKKAVDTLSRIKAQGLGKSYFHV